MKPARTKPIEMIKKEEKILFLIKFGKEKHLDSLLEKGELYFNSPKTFNDIKKLNNEQGDENEGAIWIENMKSVQITWYHPKFGEIKFKPVPQKMSKLTQFNHNFLSCSFYAISNRDFENSDILKIDSRMLEFGEYALIIPYPKELIEDTIDCGNKENLEILANKVEYKNLTLEGRIEMNPFIKKVNHNYQKEFRLVLRNCLEPSKIIKIKNIGKNGILMPSENLKELKIKNIG